MFFGQPFGAFGDPDRHIADIDIAVGASGIKLTLEAPTGLGNAYYQVYINNVFAANVYCPEGAASDTVTLPTPSASEYQVTSFRIGPNNTIDQSYFARLYDTGSQAVTAEWQWNYEVIGTADSAYLDTWSVTGLNVANVSPGGATSRGILPVTLSVSAGTANVTVGSVASGSGSVGDTITLTSLNSSNVTGSVAVDAGAESETSTLVVRWPSSMSILRDTTSPPSTVVATLPYNGLDSATYTETVEAGTYYYALRATSDTDDIGVASSPATVTVTSAPEAPTDLAYVSGSATATVIGWTPSTTAGSTYNIYVQGIGDDYLDTASTAGTAPAGASSATLPGEASYPGIVSVVVRAVSGGIEEKNLEILRLEYDSSGDIVPNRPNVPTISTVGVTDGLTANVLAGYDSAGQEAAPATIELYTRTPSTDYDFDDPASSVAVSVAINGQTAANLSTTFTIGGWYYCTAKATGETGGQSKGYAEEVAVYVSDSDATAPVGTFTAARG